MLTDQSTLHCITIQQAGIIDFEAEEEELLREDARRAKDTVCQRCHKLKYYGQVEDSLRPGIRYAYVQLP
jgi:hypothetical protein